MNPTKSCPLEHEASIAITDLLTTAVSAQSNEYTYDCLASQVSARGKVKASRKALERDTASDVRERVPAPLQRAIDLVQAKGASSWLTP